jgi:putative signal transducing protein
MEREWVQVRNCNWLHEAHFVKSVLESEGIEVQIPDEHTAGLQPGIATALGGIRVLLPAAQRAFAVEVLAAVETLTGK